MDNIESVFDQAIQEENVLITKTAKDVKAFIEKTWKCFRVELEVPLKNILPDPGKGSLNSMWLRGSADVVVYFNNRVISIIEPGGSHHFKDPVQIRRDKRKYILCRNNDIKFFKFANSLFYGLSNRKKRSMIGGAIFSK